MNYIILLTTAATKVRREPLKDFCIAPRLTIGLIAPPGWLSTSLEVCTIRDVGYNTFSDFNEHRRATASHKAPENRNTNQKTIVGYEYMLLCS